MANKMVRRYEVVAYEPDKAPRVVCVITACTPKGPNKMCRELQAICEESVCAYRVLDVTDNTF